MAELVKTELLLRREGGCTSAVSKTQTDSPSGPVSFHQRRPQRRRPETFFTVQKSKAKRRTMMTKSRTLKTSINLDRNGKTYKLFVNNTPNRYVSKAATISQYDHGEYLFGRRGRRRELVDVLKF